MRFINSVNQSLLLILEIQASKYSNIKVTPGKEVDVEYARDDIIKNIKHIFEKNCK